MLRIAATSPRSVIRFAATYEMDHLDSVPIGKRRRGPTTSRNNGTVLLDGHAVLFETKVREQIQDGGTLAKRGKIAFQAVDNKSHTGSVPPAQVLE